MIALLDTSHDLTDASAELGCQVEQLLTPLTAFSPQQPDKPYAIDNGAFSSFDANAFFSLLARETPRKHLCRFVAVPDVVGSARRTLEVFGWWKDIINRPSRPKWPLALVVQDGQQDLPIPWNEIAAIFIGGTGGERGWKMSEHVTHIIKTAQLLNKWVHVGRVNTPGRVEYFEKLGADSIDGTGLSRYTWMRERIYQAQCKPPLFTTLYEPADDLEGR